MNDRPPLLEARRLTRILPSLVPVTLVKDIDMSVGAGEFLAITGPSGSGKSSLLYLLGLLDEPTQGTVLLNGDDTSRLDAGEKARLRLEEIGFVFQFHFLLPEFTALGNVMIPMRRLGRLTHAQMREKAAAILVSFGLDDHLDKTPDQMSGGQRQRVAVARALANDPPLILADEPTGSLDTKSSDQVFGILRDLVKQRGKTVIAVTHDVDFAQGADRRIHLVDGRITEDRQQAGQGAGLARSAAENDGHPPA